MLIDTDVLIWYLRGNEKARDVIENQREFFVSVISYMELVQGLRNKVELTALRRQFRQWHVQLLYITESISAKALFYVEQHYLSHSLQVADALVGSTAVEKGLTLLTGNDKHFKIIKDLSVKKFRA